MAALSDIELLAGTRRLVCHSNRDLAALLALLAEVEARGLHRTRACASLFTYCIYELRMSEDAAFRRVGAARLVKRFPLLFGAVERDAAIFEVTRSFVEGMDRGSAPARSEGSTIDRCAVSFGDTLLRQSVRARSCIRAGA